VFIDDVWWCIMRYVIFMLQIVFLHDALSKIGGAVNRYVRVEISTN
jgi:hypothetical protein